MAKKKAKKSSGNLHARIRAETKPDTLGNRPPGRVFTHWFYDRDGLRLKIPVRLIEEKKYRQGSRRRPDDDKGHTTSTEFGVFIEEPVEIAIVATDIEHLRQSVFMALDEAGEDKWVPYYHIQIDNPHFWAGKSGEGVEVSYSYVYLTVLPDGTEVYRDNEHRHERIIKGRPKEGLEKRTGNMFSLVPVTEESEAALEKILSDFIRLRKVVCSMFSPGMVTDTLLKATQSDVPLLGMDDGANYHEKLYDEYATPEGVEKTAKKKTKRLRGKKAKGQATRKKEQDDG